MAVFRVEKNKDFTVMCNYHLRDKRLSLKAKGLLSFMLSLPEDWDYSLTGLASLCKENIKAIRSAIHELEIYGYVVRERKHGELGRFDYDYIIKEIPDVSPYTQKGHAVEGHAVNGIQINTKELNDNIDNTSCEEIHHNILTLELLKCGYLGEEEYLNSYDNLFESYLSQGYNYSQLYSSIHYVINRLKDRDYKDEYGNNITNKYGYLKTSLQTNFEKFSKNENGLWDDLDR